MANVGEIMNLYGIPPLGKCPLGKPRRRRR
jgi:hypothetical protein